jgi:hypothetical protein
MRLLADRTDKAATVVPLLIKNFHPEAKRCAIDTSSGHVNEQYHLVREIPVGVSKI